MPYVFRRDNWRSNNQSYIGLHDRTRPWTPAQSRCRWSPWATAYAFPDNQLAAANDYAVQNGWLGGFVTFFEASVGETEKILRVMNENDELDFDFDPEDLASRFSAYNLLALPPEGFDRYGLPMTTRAAEPEANDPGMILSEVESMAFDGTSAVRNLDAVLYPTAWRSAVGEVRQRLTPPSETDEEDSLAPPFLEGLLAQVRQGIFYPGSEPDVPDLPGSDFPERPRPARTIRASRERAEAGTW